MNQLLKLGLWILSIFIFVVIVPLWYLADDLEKQAAAAIDDVFGGAE